MNFAIRSQRVVFRGGIRPACIVVEDGVISEIAEFSSPPPTRELLDAGSRMILPGLVDTHVHVNEPGRTEWEGFATATRAAAAGGYTAMVDMPLNCLPATTSVSALNEKRQAASGQSWVDYAFWGGVVADNPSDLTSLAEAGVRGFKCFLVHPGIDGFTMVNRQQLEAAMPMVAQTGLPLLVHAELPAPIESARRELDRSASTDWKAYATYLRSRPDEAEVSAIRTLIEFARRFDCDVHIVHLASASALPALRTAREEGVPITVETCPHYLHFAAENIPNGATQFKCAPPIRSRENREALWAGLREGLIDLIATDHSPCLPEMKQFATGSFLDAWGGIASISVAFPVMWTEARRRGIGIFEVLRWMAEKPAELAGLAHTKGRIEVGFDADLVVFDPDSPFQVEKLRLYYRHAVSPYMGEKLQGAVEMTFVRGHKVYAHGQFAEKPQGRECPLA